MEFVGRHEEMERLDGLCRRRQGGLAVLTGRRRVGKTRLLVEWNRRHDGIYTVADQSAEIVQRRYCAEALSGKLPGFSEVEYPDWRSLLANTGIVVGVVAVVWGWWVVRNYNLYGEPLATRTFQTVFLKDRLYVSVDLKLDGLEGTNATVCLFNGTDLVATQTVMAVGPSFRKRIQLADEPKTNGLHPYRVAILPLPGEVITTNNEYAVPVMVTEERIKLLVLEGRPRWEFRSRSA